MKKGNNDKWFFALQKKIAEYLDKNYSNWQCQYQDVCENRVYENYLVFNKDNHSAVIMFVMRKVTNDYLIFEFEHNAVVNDFNYKLWDTKEKMYLCSKTGERYDVKQEIFKSEAEADTYKENFLAAGNYPDKPHTVIQIHEFKGTRFNKNLTY